MDGRLVVRVLDLCLLVWIEGDGLVDVGVVAGLERPQVVRGWQDFGSARRASHGVFEQLHQLAVTFARCIEVGRGHTAFKGGSDGLSASEGSQGGECGACASRLPQSILAFAKEVSMCGPIISDRDRMKASRVAELTEGSRDSKLLRDVSGVGRRGDQRPEAWSSNLEINPLPNCSFLSERDSIGNPDDQEARAQWDTEAAAA